MVELAEKRAIPSASFVVADLAEPLAFLADDTFDMAVAGLVLHYLRDWVASLRELRRVLRPDGTLVLPPTTRRATFTSPRPATTLPPS